uniref:Protein yippee-like n=1 Tax=Capra hircus TaxID=9925 RepID=A0A452FCW5_CAPHI
MGRIFLDISGTQFISMQFTGATSRLLLFQKNFFIYFTWRIITLQYCDSTCEFQNWVMLSSYHLVQNVSCKNCRSKLGWIYEFATEDSQFYKQGHVTLKSALVRESEGFEEEHEPSDNS